MPPLFPAICLGFLTENLTSMKQALWVSHWGPFPTPYAAQTVPFPIFLHVGTKSFSSHIPGKNLKVAIEKYSKGFQTSVASWVHRASEEAWGSTVMFPPSDQVRGRRGGVGGDELQFPYLASAWKLKKVNPGQWELSEEFSFRRLLLTNCPASFSLAPSVLSSAGDLESACYAVNSRLFS